jgi:hypothetical protein
MYPVVPSTEAKYQRSAGSTQVLSGTRVTATCLSRDS